MAEAAGADGGDAAARGDGSRADAGARSPASGASGPAADDGPGGPADASDAGRRDASVDLPGRIVLVGGMAAGKTSAGRALARRIGYRFVDLDEEVERRAGRTVPEIFGEEGEAGFRRLEAEVTRALDPVPEAGGDEAPVDPGAGEGLVVATGGGWMARPELRDRWPDAVRVWLEVSPEQALERLEGDLASRPMVDPDDPLASLRAILERRRGDYARAEHAVRTDGRSPEQVAASILEGLAGA